MAGDPGTDMSFQDFMADQADAFDWPHVNQATGRRYGHMCHPWAAGNLAAPFVTDASYSYCYSQNQCMCNYNGPNWWAAPAGTSAAQSCAATPTGANHRICWCTAAPTAPPTTTAPTTAAPTTAAPTADVHCVLGQIWRRENIEHQRMTRAVL